MASLAQKHFCKYSTLLTTCCLAYGESLSLGGYVAHRSCYAIGWILASEPGGAGVAALHFCMRVLVVMWDVPVSVTLHWKLLPSQDPCSELDWFFPVPAHVPAFLWKMLSTTPNCSHKDLSNLAGDTLMAARGHSWSLVVERVYPMGQKAMTLCAMRTKGYAGETSSRGKWNEVRGKKIVWKKCVPENVQAIKWKQNLNRWLTDRKTLRS